MNRSHQEIRELHARQEAEWKHLVQQGPKRWRSLNSIGWLVIGLLFIPVGVLGLLRAIEAIRSGNLGDVVGQDARGLQIYPADSIVRNLAITFGALCIVWLGIHRYKRCRKGDSDDKSSS